MTKKNFFSLLAFLIFTTGLLYAAENLNWRTEGLLNEKEFLEAAAQVDETSYPDADMVIIDDFITTSYEPDGRSIRRDDTVVKILTENGVDENRTITLNYEESYDEAKVYFVRIYREGKCIDIDLEKNSCVMIDNSSRDSNIYNPNEKVLAVSIPGLVKGDVLRYCFTNEILKPKFPNSFSIYELLESTNPILKTTIEVDSPLALPLRNTVIRGKFGDYLTAEDVQQKDRIIRRWHVSNMPQAFLEPDMPEAYTCLQRIVASTHENWQDVSRWYWRLCEPHLKVSDDIAKKVQELCQGRDTDGRKRAIFDFVSQQIRYLGITLETEAPGNEPHDVSITFANRHGVCRDKAALLTAMLRQAGFDAYPVLINVGQKLDNEVPMPMFNHAVTGIQNPDGTYELLDSTNETSSEYCPAYLNDKSFLVARPEGEKLQTSAIDAPEKNLVTIRTRAKMAEDGSVLGETTIDFTGINDNAYRDLFLTLQPNEQRDFFAKHLKKSFAGSEVVDMEVFPKDLQDMSTPLKVHMQYKIDNILVGNGDNMLLTMPSMDNIVGLINFAIGDTGLRTRRFPLKNSIICKNQESIELEIPLCWSKIVSLPKAYNFYNDFIDRKVKYSYDSGMMTMESSRSLKSLELTPEQYTELKNYKRDIHEKLSHKPIVRKFTGDEPKKEETVIDAPDENIPDIVFDLIDTDVKITDAQNYVVEQEFRYMICTYNGLKCFSELNFHFNPIWTETELVYARVINDGVVTNISENEQMLMDEDWVATAPRYPAGKVLVAALPSVTIGSIVEYKTRTTFHDFNSLQFNVSFRSEYPTLHQKLEMQAPESLPLNVNYLPQGLLNYSKKLKEVASKDIMPVEHTQELILDNQTRFIHHTWTCDNQRELKPEQYSLPEEWTEPTVQFKYDNWQSYCKELNQKIQEILKNTSMNADLFPLVSAIKKSPDPLDAVKNFVERRVRRDGPSFTELPLSCLSLPDKTWNDGYGNEADTALLYAAILKLCGYEPQFVLVGSYKENTAIGKYNSENPCVDDIVGLLVLLTDPQGGETWFNDLGLYGKLGTSNFAGCYCYNLTTGKKPTVLTPPQSLLSNVENYYIIEITNDGTAKIDLEVFDYGTEYNDNKTEFAELLPEQRKRYFDSLLDVISPFAVADGEMETQYEEYPGRFAFKCTVPHFAKIDGNFCYFNLPEKIFANVFISGDDRTRPLRWTLIEKHKTDIRIRIPSKFHQIDFMPQDIKWTSPSGNSSISLTNIKSDYAGEVHYVIEINQQPEIFLPEQYDELKSLHKTLSHPSSATFILRGNRQRKR